MSFQTAKQQNTGRIKGSEKTRIVNNLSSQITSLEYAEKLKKDSISKLNADIKRLEVEKERLENENKKDSKDLDSKLAKNIEKLSKEHEELEIELSSTSSLVESSNATLIEMGNSIRKKANELRQLEKIASQSNKFGKSLLDSISENGVKLDNLSKEIKAKTILKSKTSNDLSVLVDKCNELDKVISQNQDKEKVAKELDSKIASLNKVKAVKEEEVVSLKSSIESLKSEEETLQEKHEDKLKEIVSREGDLSLKESWLLDKEETLKSTKEELEKFYNRKINNVKF